MNPNPINQNPQQQAEPKKVAKYENVAESVLARVTAYQNDGSMTLPANYSIENHMKSAWLILQSTKDRNGNPVLTVCTKDSIANALLDMVLQGLAVSKSQGYFIPYGDKLEFQRSYFGTVALAKRTGGIAKDPVANIIYEGDEFIYTIDPETAQIKIIKHDQKVENIDNTKIKAAYALIKFADGSTQVVLMSMQQIRAAWNQGPTKGQSPAHKNFPDEMAKKTVIGRACKMVINSSDDAWLYADMKDEMDEDSAARQREGIVNEGKKMLDIPTDEYEDVTNSNLTPTSSVNANVAQEEGPGY